MTLDETCSIYGLGVGASGVDEPAEVDELSDTSESVDSSSASDLKIEWWIFTGDMLPSQNRDWPTFMSIATRLCCIGLGQTAGSSVAEQ